MTKFEWIGITMLAIFFFTINPWNGLDSFIPANSFLLLSITKGIISLGNAALIYLVGTAFVMFVERNKIMAKVNEWD